MDYFKPKACIIVFLIAQTLSAGDQIKIKGMVLDSISNKPLAFVNIINKNQNSGCTSDSLGLFSLLGSPNDTISFHILGYHNKTIACKNLIENDSTVRLSTKNYQIKEVTIRRFGTYEQFREMVLAFDPNKNKIKIPGLPEPKYRPIPILEDREYWKNPLGFFVSPISFLYQNLSKDAKSIYKYHDIKKQELEQLRADSKYNKGLISSLTGLTDEAEIENFMLYCNFEHDFIMQTDDYKLCELIKYKYELFRQTK